MNRAPSDRLTAVTPTTVRLCAICLLIAGAGASGPAAAQAAAEAAAVTARSAKSVAGAPAAAPRAPRAAGSTVPSEPAAAPTAAALESGPSCSGELPQPTVVRIDAGKSTLVNLPEPIVRYTLGDPEVARGALVNPQVLHVVSQKIGSTNAILQGRSGACMVLDIVVAINAQVVQSKIRELIPAETDIRVSTAADSIVLAGTVSDAVAAEQAVAIANAYVRASYQQGMPTAAGTSGGTQLAGAARVAPGGAAVLPRVVNMLAVTSGQQVMLEVKVAEISKNLLDKLGSAFNASTTNGSWTYRLLTDFLTTGVSTVGDRVTSGVASAVKSTGNALVLDAERRDGLVRILAEPNVMAISGQEGSFLAGGKILIPVSQNNALAGGVAITLEEKEFGVGLKFTPTVLAGGRINLKVAPEVSELSREGVGITSTGIAGRSVFPLITTRRATTTVQLMDGQSFAIGGLIKNSSASSLKGLPVLGELPVIGALFRSTEFQSEKTELVFIVTPRLVKPLPAERTPLPTDKVTEPSRTDLFLWGRIEGAPPAESPVNTGGMLLK
jgi:pilus assembly protein CpaC